MIYLIDDKKLRQEKDYNWSSERLVKYGKFIIPIYTLIELQSRNQEIFQEGNIILYHESFIDKTQIRNEAVERRKKLEEFSKNKSSYIVFFSGSKSDRDLKDNIANIPVSVLYKNLEVFIRKYSENDIKLEYLLFGENPRIEETLINKFNDGLLITQSELPTTTNKENLFIRPSKNNINQPLNACNEKVIFNKCSDEDFSEKILEWLNDSEYDNIFVPLCFGKTLSDFNGLRLAAHIRCTNTRNQTTPLYIYGFVGIEYLLENEYFNILRTKNVFLIPFSKKAIGEAAEKTLPPFSIKELPKEVAKLKLDVPKNYADNHSIVNEWSIYRWATALKVEDEHIRAIEKNVGSNLYFKYLKAQFPIKETIDANNQIITEEGKILYIDDEVEKGWDIIFRKICTLKRYESIGNDFKNLDSSRIVESAITKVNEFNPDVIILDFRLHDDDFESITPEKVTGYRILREIKKFNQGIQVIILSATNKIWNLLELQKTDVNGIAGADGFILKESPELSVDESYSKDTVLKIYKTINKSLSKKYLKKIYTAWKKSIQTTGNSDEKFISESKTALNTAWELIKSEHLDMGFLMIYQTIESYANKLYQTEGNQDSISGTTVIEKSGEKENIWKLKFNEDKKKGNYFNVNDHEQDKKQRPTTLFKVSCLFHIMYNYDDNQLKEIGKLNQIRNNIAHGKTVPKDQKQHSTKDDFVKLLDLLMTIRKT